MKFFSFLKFLHFNENFAIFIESFKNSGKIFEK